MTTTPTSIDERIAKLQLQRDDLDKARRLAQLAFDNVSDLLSYQLTMVPDDVEALRALPELLREYTYVARQYHRVVTGQRLKRNQETLPGIEETSV